MPSTLSCNNCGAANQPQAAYCRSCGSSLQAVKPTMYHSTTGRLLANVTLKQRYRIIAPVGKGGMGAVYKAEDTMLGNRQVALKEMSQSGLSPQEQKEAADAFRQEALMLARLQHPNLPNIFDHFEENGRWYLAMSFIEGETLEDYLGHTQGGKLPLEEVLQIGTQLCSVLGYLHNRQPAIIFRDLKPANIMRTPDGHIYLIDFGIARHFKPGQIKDTAYYGSMGYAPPEQYGKAQTTPRSDIYSLGATLYQLVSGHDPSSSPFRFPLLQSLVPAAPAGLTTLLTRMLELDEDKRPASMLLVKQELQALTSSIVQKSDLQMPAPSQASVAPTQPAKPNPSPVAVAPTQPASSPASAIPPKSAAKLINMWAFGKKQFVTMLILVACYGIISFVLLSIYVQTFEGPGLANFDLLWFEQGLLFSFAIFLASFFGPWVGTGGTGIGFFLAYFIYASTGPFGLQFGLEDLNIWVPWETGIILMFSAFLAGLFLIKTKGHYAKLSNVLFVWVLGVIYICLALVLILIMDQIVYQFQYLSSYFRVLLPFIIPTLVLLPLLLFVSNAVSSAWNRRYIQNHP